MTQSTLQIKSFKNVESNQSCQPLSIGWHLPHPAPPVVREDGLIHGAAVIGQILWCQQSAMLVYCCADGMGNASLIETCFALAGQFLRISSCWFQPSRTHQGEVQGSYGVCQFFVDCTCTCLCECMHVCVSVMSRSYMLDPMCLWHLCVLY